MQLSEAKVIAAETRQGSEKDVYLQNVTVVISLKEETLEKQKEGKKPAHAPKIPGTVDSRRKFMSVFKVR